MFSKKKKSETQPDGQMELFDHLAELRTRIFRSIIYIVVGMILTYGLFPWMYNIIASPITEILKHLPGGSGIKLDNIAEGFLIRMQFAFIGGLVVAFPLVVLELWGFIEPALTPEERKPVRFLAPFSLLLFLMGVLVAYACLPATYQWMASYAADIKGAVVLLNAQQYLTLSVKIMLIFGVAFQLPLVLLFLARVGIITADMMSQYWRHAVVGISVVAAIIAPSADPITMLMMAIPMAVLYMLSIGLVRAFEPKADGSTSISFGTMFLISLVPIGIVLAVAFYLWRTYPAAAAVVPPNDSKAVPRVSAANR